MSGQLTEEQMDALLQFSATFIFQKLYAMNERQQPAQSGNIPFYVPTSSAGSNNTGYSDLDLPGQQPKRRRRAFWTQSACRRCRKKKSKVLLPPITQSCDQR